MARSYSAGESRSAKEDEKLLSQRKDWESVRWDGETRGNFESDGSYTLPNDPQGRAEAQEIFYKIDAKREGSDDHILKWGGDAKAREHNKNLTDAWRNLNEQKRFGGGNDKIVIPKKTIDLVGDWRPERYYEGD